MSHVHRSSSLWCSFAGPFGAGIAFFVAGCTTGQTGGEIEYSDGTRDEDAAGNSCEEVTATPLELEDETPIGVTAQDLIDAIAGVHETTLAWGGDLSEADYELSPAAGDSTITVEVIPRPESAVYVDLAVEQSDQEDDRALIGELSEEACADEVRVTADVIVSSENGAFDDSFEATFSTKTGSVVASTIEIVPGELDGAFDVTSDRNGEAVQTTMTLSFAFGTLSGDVSGIWQEVHGDPGDSDSAVSASPMRYARFPADGCEWGTLVSEDSQWGEAIFDAIGASSVFELEWQNGDQATLSVDTSVEKLCLEVSGGEASGVIVGDGVSVVTSDDGRVDASWDVQVRAWIEDDAITSLSVTSVEAEYEGSSAEEFAVQSGISGIETDATDLAFQFTYSAGVSDELSSGSLTVFELSIPDCARPDYEPEVVETPDGGSGSDGCEGTELVELETATFSESSAK